MAPHLKTKEIGIRPGEKIHEEMITTADSYSTIDLGKYYAILPPNGQLQKKYEEQKLSWDKLYYGTVPILQHCDLLRKIPKEYNLIIRCDWNTQIDRQVDLHHWYRKAFEQGPIGFMVRDNRGPNFGSGKLQELPKDENDINNDWFHFLPSSLIIHHRKHFDVKQVTQLDKNCELLPNEWGWYQVLSAPYGGIHTSVHGFAKELK